jgi:hypothetical protein
LAFVAINEIIFIRRDLVIVYPFPPGAGLSGYNSECSSACCGELMWTPDTLVVISERDSITLKVESLGEAMCGDDSALAFS